MWFTNDHPGLLLASLNSFDLWRMIWINKNEHDRAKHTERGIESNSSGSPRALRTTFVRSVILKYICVLCSCHLVMTAMKPKLWVRACVCGIKVGEKKSDFCYWMLSIIFQLSSDVVSDNLRQEKIPVYLRLIVFPLFLIKLVQKSFLSLSSF